HQLCTESREMYSPVYKHPSIRAAHAKPQPTPAKCISTKKPPAGPGGFTIQPPSPIKKAQQDDFSPEYSYHTTMFGKCKFANVLLVFYLHVFHCRKSRT